MTLPLQEGCTCFTYYLAVSLPLSIERKESMEEECKQAGGDPITGPGKRRRTYSKQAYEIKRDRKSKGLTSLYVPPNSPGLLSQSHFTWGSLKGYNQLLAFPTDHEDPPLVTLLITTLPGVAFLAFKIGGLEGEKQPNQLTGSIINSKRIAHFFKRKGEGKASLPLLPHPPSGGRGPVGVLRDSLPSSGRHAVRISDLSTRWQVKLQTAP